MGTRNLTIVILNGETKIAQYGQWDGYPEGQGQTALQFLLSANLEKFKKKLSSVRFENETDEKEKDDFLEKIGSNDGWLSMEQSDKFHKKYRFDSRDHAAKILQMIADAEEKEIVLVNSMSFAEDSLFCEWAYVIDFDKNTFEVYKGFNKKKLAKKERFYPLQKESEEYKPIKLYKSYNLDNLPTIGEFIGKKEKTHSS